MPIVLGASAVVSAKVLFLGRPYVARLSAIDQLSFLFIACGNGHMETPSAFALRFRCAFVKGKELAHLGSIRAELLGVSSKGKHVCCRRLKHEEGRCTDSLGIMGVLRRWVAPQGSFRRLHGCVRHFTPPFHKEELAPGPTWAFMGSSSQGELLFLAPRWGLWGGSPQGEPGW